MYLIGSTGFALRSQVSCATPAAVSAASYWGRVSGAAALGGWSLAWPSSSTSNVSTATATVVIEAEAVSEALAPPAVTVEVLETPSAVEAGGVTLTQTSKVAPAPRLGVAVIAVEQVASKNVTGNVPPLADRLKWSGL